MVVAAWLIRRRLEEAPSFVETQAQQVIVPARRKTPLGQVFAQHKRGVATVALCAMINTVNMVFTTFSISFATKGHGLDSGVMLWVPIASNGLSLLAIPFWAGADLTNWVGPAAFTLAMATLAGAVALTARETGTLTLAEVDKVHS